MNAHPTTLIGVNNFRDLGGLRTVDGRMVRSGKLFRSDSLDDLTATDVLALRDVMKVVTVIDLRAAIEFEDTLPTWFDEIGATHRNLPLTSTWEKWDPDEASAALTMMAQKYLNYVTDARENIVEAIDIVAGNATTDGSTIFHCTAGKDRTGILATLVLGLLDVEREDIVCDYVETSIHLPRIMEKLANNPKYAGRIAINPPEVYEATEQTIREFIDGFLARYRSFEEWATSAGLDDSVVETLRTGLLTPVEDLEGTVRQGTGEALP